MKRGLLAIVVLAGLFLGGCATTEQRQARVYEQFLKTQLGDLSAVNVRHAGLDGGATRPD